MTHLSGSLLFLSSKRSRRLFYSNFALLLQLPLPLMHCSVHSALFGFVSRADAPDGLSFGCLQ